MIFLDDVWRAGRDNPNPGLVVLSLAVIGGFIGFMIWANKKGR